jgi:hypothetical protein
MKVSSIFRFVRWWFCKKPDGQNYDKYAAISGSSASGIQLSGK